MNKWLFTLCILPVLCTACFIPSPRTASNEDYQAFQKDCEEMLRMTTHQKTENNSIYAYFEQMKLLYKAEGDTRVKPSYEKAQQLKRLSTELTEEIDLMRAELVAHVENMSVDEAKKYRYYFHSKKKWMDVSNSDSFFETDDETGNIVRLRKTLETYRNRLHSEEFLWSLKDTQRVKLLLDMHPMKERWETFYFEDRPPISAYNELVRCQYHIRACEYSMLKYLEDKLGSSFYRFGSLSAEIIPESYRVEQGKEFVATIVLSADDQGRPKINVNGKTVKEYKKGKGIYREKASAPGIKKVKGEVLIHHPMTGEIIALPFETEYEVVNK